MEDQKEEVLDLLARFALFTISFGAGCTAYIVFMAVPEALCFLHGNTGSPRLVYFLPAILAVGGVLKTRTNPILGGFCGGIVFLGSLLSLYLWNSP